MIAKGGDTFGDTILMNSFRNRNFPTTPWTCAPHALTQASNTCALRPGRGACLHDAAPVYARSPRRTTRTTRKGPTARGGARVSLAFTYMPPSSNHRESYIPSGQQEQLFGCGAESCPGASAHSQPLCAARCVAKTANVHQPPVGSAEGTFNRLRHRAAPHRAPPPQESSKQRCMFFISHQWAA